MVIEMVRKNLPRLLINDKEFVFYYDKYDDAKGKTVT